MSENTQPNIQQTLIENVLIKYPVLDTNRYAQSVVKQAHQKAKAHIQQAQQSEKNIHTIAYQQGYQDGLTQLLNDFIGALNDSEAQYQNQVSQTESQLTQLLIGLFTDARLQEIVVEHFAQLQSEARQVQLHIPASLQTKISTRANGTKICTSPDNSITLEVNNEITQFSPKLAAEKILPHIFPISTRCLILQQHKQAYALLIQQKRLIQQERALQQEETRRGKYEN
ncbi:hypothetical protein M5X66_00755 [Providencia sp. PROV188]|uniref:hypothetical protein n=1 Tax=unclassified Providencia TaxID=2633465 RepID=UPI0012B594A3|nr:hypothetical protein [Providencia sp. PROV211]MTC23199.1 hypothetical protein [Providencia sp. wls1938]MTC47248.1 hypothetical protein [Providencia sp. wls1922]MTC78252.1 hypothetical protein [Providencia sp. wls1916]WBM60948.1 hypothetical protein M5X66_00755 [Providencia sp. PROV188]